MKSTSLFFIAVKAAVSSLHNTAGTSVYEAKAGVKAARQQANFNCGGDKDVVTLSPIVKKALKQITLHVKSQSYGVAEPEPNAMKRFEKILRRVLESQWFNEYEVPEGSWGTRLKQKTFFGGKHPWFHIGFNAFGAMEARVIIDGERTIGGAALDQALGQTLKDKRRNLIAMSGEQLTELVEKVGFIATFGAGYAIMVPTVFLVFQLATVRCFGLRWTPSADLADTGHSMQQLKMLMDEFLEVRASNTGYIGAYEHFVRMAESA